MRSPCSSTPTCKPRHACPLSRLRTAPSSFIRTGGKVARSFLFMAGRSMPTCGRPRVRRWASAGFRVISYDRRGFGRSDQPWTGYDYNTMSNDLAAIIAGLALKDAALVGFSMGGGEIARYMSRHGGRDVSKVVLVSSICPFLLKTPDHPNGAPKDLFRRHREGTRARPPALPAGLLQEGLRRRPPVLAGVERCAAMGPEPRDAGEPQGDDRLRARLRGNRPAR